MVHCCIPSCPSGRGSDLNVSFHSFPSNPDIAAYWIRNINRLIPNGGTWFPQPGDLVCSKHFVLSDFNLESGTPILKRQCVPTIFDKSADIRVLPGEANTIKRKREDRSPVIVKVMKPVSDDDDSSMDDTPLTELLRDRNSASSSSTSYTKNSPLNYVRVSASTESHKPSHEPHTSRSYRTSFVATSNESGRTPTKDLENERSRFRTHMCENVTSTDVNKKVKVIKQPAKRAVRSAAHGSAPIAESSSACPKNDQAGDLIEIGPSTFLKINPEIIKVTKKVTQSGNTVLQFVMNPNLGIDARSVFQTVSNPSKNHGKDSQACDGSLNNNKLLANPSNGLSREADPLVPVTTSNNDVFADMQDASQFTPAILSTNLPVSHSFGLTWKQRHTSVLRQKNRQIHTLKTKLDKLLKKVDELETKCIVQERQLDFPSLKKLKAIKKNADKGEPHACFILEQIRGYFGNIPLRWSDSTMTQCSIWCRKAPYAYEYFKKADLFRLPCLGTVKRYMKKHPEITTQIKNRIIGVHSLDSDDSSSDFDFDEDENEVPNEEDSVDNPGINNSEVPCDISLNEDYSVPNENSQVGIIVPDAVPIEPSQGDFAPVSATSDFQVPSMPLLSEVDESLNKSNSTADFSNPDNATVHEDGVNQNHQTIELDEDKSVQHVSSDEISNDMAKTVPQGDLKSIYLPTSSQDGHITAVNMNGQEIILQPGNIIQLNSELGNTEGMENQFFVIPSADEQTTGDHQYSVAQPVSFVIQNGEDNQQVIYITEDNLNVPERVAVSLSENL